ncbi:double zinc ribbon domain-containing protein [Paenibacillus alvei]|uniref:DZANK-type domain-containing protein n=1 Tax=Paenibacillus alvei TaxID=44250 RepID=A0AAP7A0G2_PAEAL|nr:zinc ribbon domain-containing protein [Paenibacillus alvei]MBG9733277.1 hypothetical protein [Paenibacillus alvei]MBG9745164.1 hypothetical protein [Paenibacillus alvei]MCY9580699.1 zinc ribbon domain-containing protein [Paenibacillus alvei]MCY9585182.1 zinc ribbon domain-containing protein [Paenibacillus alvei]NEZ45047.1 hypothetical protein [Paenibacillus alvei]
MAIKICSNCGESNKESAMLCIACSHSLKDATIEGTPEDEKQYNGILSVNQAELTCSHCHEKVEQGALKCKYCGSVIPSQSEQKLTSEATAQPSSSESGPGCAALLLVLVATAIFPLVGLLIGGVLAFHNDKDKQNLGTVLLVLGLLLELGYWLLR